MEDLKALIAKTEAQEGKESALLGTLYRQVAKAYQRKIDQGRSQNLQQDREIVIANYEKAIALQSSLAQDGPKLQSWMDLGQFYASQGLFQDAKPLLENALKLARTIHDLRGEARACYELSRF